MALATSSVSADPKPSVSRLQSRVTQPDATSELASGSSNAQGFLPPAVRISLSSSTQLTSARLLTYGRPGTPQTDDKNASANAADTDPARNLDRKVAEARKEVAAIQIRQTKAAARDAGVLALLNPAGGISFAKHASKTLSSAMQTFSEAEQTIRRTEDESIAATTPEVITAVAYDVYEQTSMLELTEQGRRDVEAAVARLPERQAAALPSQDERSDPVKSAALNVTSQVEALSVVQVKDDSNIAARAAKVDADRSQRMSEDAEVIKDGVSGLRYLDRLIALSTRRLQETGRMDARTAREANEARTAWHDAVANTAVAALPIVQAGYSIAPDDEA